MKIINFLKKHLIYNGLDEETYKASRSAIVKSNIKLLRLYSIIIVLTLLVMLVIAVLNDSINKNIPLYIACIALALIIIALSFTFCKKSKFLTSLLVYIFILGALSYGIIMGTIISPNDLTVSYVVLLFAVPLMFTEISGAIDLIILFSIIVYFVIGYINGMPKQVLFDNSTTVIPYGMISFFVTIYIQGAKTKSIAYQQKIEVMSLTDQLTGLLNRRSADAEIERLTAQNSTVLAFMLDVNGLKKTNDTLGHDAGDEIITGAANIINTAFGAYGKCFRIGGDEFLVLIENPTVDPEELKARVIKLCSEWHGKKVESISLAIGYSTTTDGIQVLQTTDLADKLMYENKSLYYNECRKD